MSTQNVSLEEGGREGGRGVQGWQEIGVVLLGASKSRKEGGRGGNVGKEGGTGMWGRREGLRGVYSSRRRRRGCIVHLKSSPSIHCALPVLTSVVYWLSYLNWSQKIRTLHAGNLSV